MSEWAITLSGRTLQRSIAPRSSASSAAIWASGKGCSAVLASSTPIEREFTSATPPQDPAPACQARFSSGTISQTSPRSPIR